MADKKQLIVEILGKTKGLEDATKKAEGEFNKITQMAKNVAGALGVAFGAREAIRFGSELVQLAGRAEGVERAFQKLNNPRLLEDLQKATRGTIADIELMRSAVRAQNFKIPLEQLATYFEFATNRAIETGESVDYLVNSIIDGIGRKSSLVLDNLGISAAELQDEIKKVGDFGEAAGIIIQRELAKAGDVADTTATKISRLAADFENWKRKAGGAIVEIYDFLREGAEPFINLTDKAADANVEYIRTLVENNDELRKEAEAFRKATEEAQKHKDMVADNRIALDEFKKTVDGTINAFSTYRAGMSTMFDMYIQNQGVLADVEVQISRLEAKRLAASESEIAAINREIKALNDKKQALLKLGLEQKTPQSSRVNLAGVGDNMTSGVSGVGGLPFVPDGYYAKANDSLTEYADVVADKTAQITTSFANMAVGIGVSMAESVGAVAGAGGSFQDIISDIGQYIWGAIGDIMIMIGTALGPTPLGIGLVLGGLAFKGIQAFANARGQEGSMIGIAAPARTGQAVGTGSSMLYGNDIQTANNFSVQQSNRVG